MSKIAFIFLYIILSRGQELPPFETLQSPAHLLEIVTQNNNLNQPTDSGLVQATVTTVNLSPLAYDGSAVINVATATGNQVLEVPARINLCAGQNNITNLGEIRVGDVVTYRGQVMAGVISICDGDSSLHIVESADNEVVEPLPIQDVAVTMIGEVVQVGGLEVRIIRLIEDSRCPVDVNCIQAGKVVIELEVKNNFNETRPISLSSDQASKVFGQSINLVDVRPLAKTGRRVSKTDYQFTISVN